MGNLCGKQSDDNFTTQGRTVGSAPPPQSSTARSQIPAQATKPQVQGPGRTVGGGPGVAGATGGQGAAAGDSDPRAAAARAAEERANKLQAQNKGKLGEQLAAQRKQTRVDTLEQASQQTRGARTADENAAARSWN